MPSWDSVYQEGNSVLPNRNGVFYSEVPGSSVAKREKKGFVLLKKTYFSAFSFPSSSFLSNCENSFPMALGAEA